MTVPRIEQRPRIAQTRQQRFSARIAREEEKEAYQLDKIYLDP